MKRKLLWSLLMVLAEVGAQTPPVAEKPADVPAQIEEERERVRDERTRIEQAHDQQMRECWQRFAVNDCLRAVRRSRLAALAPLRARDLSLNEQERAWRTQQRQERLQDKQQPQADGP